jgi:FeS assembly SUF system protein
MVAALNERSELVQERDEREVLDQIIAALRTVYDPEISTNIYDLGLIYAIDAVGEHDIAIKMTLTAPGCPVAGILPGEVERAVESVDAVGRCHVELVWDPPWTKDRMSDEARLELGMF